MSINERTKYRIANQWINGAIDKNSYEFSNKGKFAVGKFAWSTAVKKDGKQEFTSHKIDFVCFGDSISIIEKNLGATFDINGKLEQYSYINKRDGDKKVYSYKIVVNEVRILEAKQIDKHSEAKANGYVKEQSIDDFIDDDTIPWM